MYFCQNFANGSVAEWSKALDLGSSLSGGVGSNPTAIISFFCSSTFIFRLFVLVSIKRQSKHGQVAEDFPDCEGLKTIIKQYGPYRC